MIIQHNIMAINAYRQLGQNNGAVSKNLEKLSSGYKINRAGDDAAGLAISEKMRSQIKGLETAQKNALDGISLVQTAEGALTEVHSMLNRMIELSTQAANGTYKDNDRTKIQSEMDSLLDEIDRIVNSTNFNGLKLLDGTELNDTKLQVGATGSESIGITVASLSTTALGIDVLKTGGTGAFGGATGTTEANAAIALINDAIDTVSGTRSDLGAIQNRLEHTINNLGVTTENMTAAESRIRDVDMAKEMMTYTKNNVLIQAAQAMLAQANQQPQAVLQLLR